MKKNLFAIEIAVAIILITMLLTGIFLSEILITWLAIGLIVLGSLAIVIIKIINLSKQGAQEATANNEENADGKKNFFTDIKHSWRFSTNGEKIKSVLFVFTILICSIAFIVLCSYGYVIPGLIVVGSGIGLIVCSLIVMAVIEKILIKKMEKQKLEYKQTEYMSFSQDTSTVDKDKSDENESNKD